MMLKQIKALADAAIALQNKVQMEVALREISALCDGPAKPAIASVAPAQSEPEVAADEVEAPKKAMKK